MRLLVNDKAPVQIIKPYIHTSIAAVVGASTIFGNRVSRVIGFFAFDTDMVILLRKRKGLQTREPANKLITSQRDLKYSDTRQIAQLMAVALSQRSNAVDGCFRSRPTGLTIKSIPCVMSSRLSPLGLRKHALMLNLNVSLRFHELIRRFP